MSERVRRGPFVDDGAKALDKLQQMLRSQDSWEMAFAPSGEVALALVDAAPFDVIVSDLRMPGMDAAIAAHVLQLVNSAFFGLVQPITTIRSAVSCPGIDMLRTVVMSGEIFRLFGPGKNLPGFSPEALQYRAQLTAAWQGACPCRGTW